jgi:hypothetical protein
LSSVALAYTARIVRGRERGSFEGRVAWLKPNELYGRMALGNERMLADYLAQPSRFDSADLTRV